MEDTVTATQLGHYIAGLTYATDYYPFGQTLPGRTFYPLYCHKDSTAVVDTAFADDCSATTNWVNNIFSAVSISSGQLQVSYSSGGRVKANWQTGANFSMIAGKTYTASFYVDPNGCGTIRVILTDPASGSTFMDCSSAGTYFFSYTASGSGTGSISFVHLGTGSCSFLVDDVLCTYGAYDYSTVCGSGAANPNNKYRYGFNGKEKDNETYGEGNAYDFGARIYDPRLGKWMSCDPLQGKYPDLSPYNFTMNNPILLIDPDGRIVTIKDVASLKAVLGTLSAAEISRININKDGTISIKAITGPNSRNLTNLQTLVDSKVNHNFMTSDNYESKVGNVELPPLRCICNAAVIKM